MRIEEFKHFKIRVPYLRSSLFLCYFSNFLSKPSKVSVAFKVGVAASREDGRGGSLLDFTGF